MYLYWIRKLTVSLGVINPLHKFNQDMELAIGQSSDIVKCVTARHDKIILMEKSIDTLIYGYLIAILFVVSFSK